MWSLLNQDGEEKTRELSMEERKEVARVFVRNSREGGLAPSAALLMRRYLISRKMATDLLKEKTGDDHDITGEYIRMKEDVSMTESSKYAVKRRYRRFTVDNKDLITHTLFDLEAELLNISVGGACVKTEQSLKSARMVKLQSKKSSLALPCSVVWEAAGKPEEASVKSAHFYRTGVSFMGLLPNTLEELKDFIRESGVPAEQRAGDTYRPSLLRFQMHTNKKAVLYYTETLPVRKISLGGMLVELRRDIRPGEVFPMELFIPNAGPPLRFHGRVASSIPAQHKGPRRFDIGIEFLDIDMIDNFRLSKFILFREDPERIDFPLLDQTVRYLKESTNRVRLLPDTFQRKFNHDDNW